MLPDSSPIFESSFHEIAAHTTTPPRLICCTYRWYYVSYILINISTKEDLLIMNIIRNTANRYSEINSKPKDKIIQSIVIEMLCQQKSIENIQFHIWMHFYVQEQIILLIDHSSLKESNTQVYDVPTLNVTIIYKRRIAWYIYSIAATSRLNNFCGIQGEQIKSEEGNIWCICLNRLMIYSPRKKLYVIRDIYQYCLLE